MQARRAPARPDSSGSPAEVREDQDSWHQGTQGGMWVAPYLVMTFRRAAGLCFILAAILGIGCAGRLSTIRSAAVHSNGLTARFAEAGTSGTKDSATASGKNSPDRKATEATQQPLRRPSGASTQLPGDPPVGTSGKWVVTAITQRPDEPAAAASTHSVMSEARTPRGVWPMAVAGLALAICLVVIARAAYSSRRT